MIILERIKKQVKRNPDKIFYFNGIEKITYFELWEKASYYSEFFIKQGNSPVIIYGDKELYVIISIIACIIANRPYVPVASYTPENRLKKIVDITNSTLIISDTFVSIYNVDCVKLENICNYDHNYSLNKNNNYAYIIFTSGSTGEPKGVPISYNNLNNFIEWMSNISLLKNLNNINVLNMANFSFDLSVADFYYSLCNGHTLRAITNNFDYENLFNVFNDDNINFAVITPTFAKLLFLNNDFNQENFPHFKYIYFCGEILDTKLVKKIFQNFPDIKVINAYGPTEATSAVSAIEITEDMVDLEILPVGHIDSFATDIEIIDDEIVLKGDSVFSGYLGFDSDSYYLQDNINCYKTGDIGYIQNNMLFCRGRKDDQIKYKGYRIELNDIKRNIDNIYGVEDSVVVPLYKDDVVKNIVAYIVGDITSEIISDELKKMLPFYMIPGIIRIVDSIPINNNGKVNREGLRKYD